LTGTDHGSDLVFACSMMLGLSRLRLAGLARLMALVLTLVFASPAVAGVCCSGIAEIAGQQAADVVDDCCPGAGQTAEKDHADSEEPCSCPFPCSTGCSGQPTRALLAGATVEVMPPGVEARVSALDRHQDPQAPDPNDILHVPKRSDV
jgi:hypothetical protein